jgi:hypothetical protein
MVVVSFAGCCAALVQVEGWIAVVVERADRTKWLPTPVVDLDAKGFCHDFDVGALDDTRNLVISALCSSRQTLFPIPVATSKGAARTVMTQGELWNQWKRRSLPSCRLIATSRSG